MFLALLNLLPRAIVKQYAERCFCSHSPTYDSITTASIIVIGDEILKGHVLDTNSNYLAKELHRLGLRLKKISVVGDEIGAIAKEVKLFSDNYDYVITSGGIGPTHDDVTFEAVAQAFNEPLYLNPDLRDICAKFYGTEDEKSPGMKLAYLPKSAKLTFMSSDGVKMKYPQVSVRNVFMFPGIPQLCRNMFSHVSSTLFKSNKKFFVKSVYCNLSEVHIVAALNELVKEFPEVQFGSYPRVFDSTYKVKVTIESCNEDATQKAYEKLLELIPSEFIVNKDNV